MALAVYTLGDRDYQFDTDDVPKGAVLVKAEKSAPKEKRGKPANKQAAAPQNKDESSSKTDDADESSDD